MSGRLTITQKRDILINSLVEELKRDVDSNFSETLQKVPKNDIQVAEKVLNQIVNYILSKENVNVQILRQALLYQSEYVYLPQVETPYPAFWFVLRQKMIKKEYDKALRILEARERFAHVEEFDWYGNLLIYLDEKEFIQSKEVTEKVALMPIDDFNVTAARKLYTEWDGGREKGKIIISVRSYLSKALLNKIIAENWRPKKRKLQGMEALLFELYNNK